MSTLAISVTVEGRIEDVFQLVAEAIKPAGFGILTRIDFDKKIKEKLNETIPPCIIMGAFNFSPEGDVPIKASETYRSQPSPKNNSS